jgi:hypothetical protein
VSADPLRQKLAAIWPLLDERARRVMAASEALALPYGVVARVHRACELSRNVIAKGIREIEAGAVLAPGRQRRAGAGRKRITEHGARVIDQIGYILIDATAPISSPISSLVATSAARSSGSVIIASARGTRSSVIP